MPRSRRFRYVDAFSGIGGFSQAAHRSGGQLVAACDIDPFAREIFARNHGVVPHDDIRTFPPPLRDSRVDLLCGGFPCQPFSRAGERRGTEEDRGQLFFAVLRYARANHIPCLLLENVVGLLSIDEGRTFALFIAHLRRAGYKVAFAVLNSHDFGCPQVRKRLFIVAHRSKLFDFTPLLQHNPVHVPLRDFLDPDLALCRRLHFPTEVVLPARKQPSGILRCDPPVEVSGIQTDQTRRVYHPDGPVATLVASNTTKIYDPRLRIPRKLTPRELLACQGFPHTFQMPDDLAPSLASRLCGNAVSVPVVEAILRAMLQQGLLPAA